MMMKMMMMTVDCMIASVAMNYKIALIHNDKDFDPIEEKLKLIKY